MARVGRISVGIDIEPFCKIVCLNTHCKYHLIRKDWMACNLKYVEIDQTRTCRQFEAKTDNNDIGDTKPN